MRILLIHNYLALRGGEDVMFDSLINLLKQKGHSIVTYTKRSSEIEGKLSLKLKTAAEMFVNRQVKRELQDIISQFKPQITHVSNIFPLLTPLIYPLIKSFKVPIIQSIHSHRLLCPKSTLFRNGKICTLCIKKRFKYPSIIYGCYHNSRTASFFLNSSFIYHRMADKLNLIDKFIFPAKYARDLHTKYLSIPRKKTVIIPNFIEEEYLDLKPAEKSNSFLFVGRLSEEKGILNLLEIFSTLPEIKLIAIGNGPLLNNVLKYKKYKNISIKINLQKKEIYGYMKKALCTIIPSAPLYEFGPLVLIESFANGTPVLVPEAGVFKERVINNKTGFFYDSGNYEDLRDKVVEISNYKSNNFNKINSNILEEFENKYTTNVHYRLLLRSYNDLI